MIKIKVINKDETKPMAVEIIAESIEIISNGIKELRNSPLNDKALYLLIQHAAPTGRYNQRIGISDIRAVIEGIESLEGTYLKKKPKVIK